MKKLFIFFLSIVFTTVLGAQQVNPLDLEFQRLSVRRFIFSNNIGLSVFKPSEIVAFASMHPAFTVSNDNKPLNDETFNAMIIEGNLVLDTTCGYNPACFYVGGVNPYATYEIDIVSADTTGNHPPEAGFELARLGLRDRIQVVTRLSGKEKGVYLRIYKNAVLNRETKYSDFVPSAPFKLRVQLYGNALGIFTEENGESTYIGHVRGIENFSDILDFRRINVLKECTFNLISNLQGVTVIGGARSYLSAGIGQADIRMISYEDLSPYMDDGRLWFTISCRGIEIDQSAQGVISMDPSVFDVRFEGMIVFDHGDGLLRNNISSHLFYDRNAGEWRTYTCDFGGTAGIDQRSGTGLLTAHSSKDPRRGFSVMQAARIEPDKMDGRNEDPCIFYDANTKKWKLLTSAFVNNTITSRTYESDTWDGKFVPVALPISLNSTGTSVQKIGNTYYAFMGGLGNLRVHTFPDLELLGELNLNLQPHWPKPAGRVWASIAPLPQGFPYRYVLLTMDRPNFPGITVPTWSYGALYFYGANPP